MTQACKAREEKANEETHGATETRTSQTQEKRTQGGTVPELDKIWCHPEACRKVQREPVSKSGATSPHKHRRSVNADKRMPKTNKKKHASKSKKATEPNEWESTWQEQGNAAKGKPMKRILKQNNHMMQHGEVPKSKRDKGKSHVWRSYTKEEHTCRQAMNTVHDIDTLCSKAGSIRTPKVRRTKPGVNPCLNEGRYAIFSQGNE